MTEEQQYQQLLIDAICGVGFPSVILAQECERVGLARFDHLLQEWRWDRKALWKVGLEPLQELYQGLCESREELLTPTEPLDEPPSLIITGVQ